MALRDGPQTLVASFFWVGGGSVAIIQRPASTDLLMSDISRFLASVNYFFGSLAQAGRTPDLMRGVAHDIEQFGKSGAPSAVEVADVLKSLMTKLEPEWVARPGTALMELCRALLSVQQAYATRPADMHRVLAAIERQSEDLVL